MIITDKNYKELIRGASLLSTGGGLSFKEQVKSFKKLGSFHIPVKTINSFSNNSFILRASEIGDSDAPPVQKEAYIHGMLAELKKLVKAPIAGIYPRELGQESIVIEAAHYLQLPIVDIDIAGCRAVPFSDITLFHLKQIDYSLSPLVACTDQGKIIVIEDSMSAKALERRLRYLTTFSKTGVIFYIGGLVKVDIIKKITSNSFPYHYAYSLHKYSSFTALLEKLNPLYNILCTVEDVKKYSADGFSWKKIVILANTGKKYVLLTYNETIFLQDNQEKIIASVPQRILLVDKKQMRGLHTSELVQGKKLHILVIAPEKEWQIPKAQKLFGKERFKDMIK